MKTTITSSPDAVCLAGNPITFAVKTDKRLGVGESFLRILCKATFTLNGSVEHYSGNRNFTVELSQPVEDAGTAVFNLSDAALTLIRNMQSSIDMNGAHAFAHYGLIANVHFRTAFVYENQEEQSTDDESAFAPFVFIVPGAHTDFELLTTYNGVPLTELAAGGRAMTRKPDGGVLYKGETLIVPTLYTHPAEDPDYVFTLNTDAVLSVGGQEVARKPHAIDSNELDYLSLPTDGVETEGKFTFSSTPTGDVSGYFCTRTQGVRFLRFINGYGAIENIAVRAKDKLSYETGGETHSLVQGGTLVPTDRRYATKSQPVGVLELSSGYVPKRWALWYVQELLTSPRVWIQVGGKWLPALIESDDECVIYDRTNPEMPHVDFKLRLAVDGVVNL